MAKIPDSVPEDVKAAFRDLEERLRRIEHDDGVNLKGRRIGNAGTPIEDRDYVHKHYVDSRLDELRRAIQRAPRGVVTDSSTEAPVPPPIPPPVPPPVPPPPNPGGLPCANHAIDFGYWIPDGNIPPLIDRSHYAENAPYTDMYIAWFRVGRQYCASEAPVSEMMAVGIELMQRAYNDNKIINLMMDLTFAPDGNIGAHMDRVIDAAQPFWAKVKYIDLSDEPGWSREELEGYLGQLRSKLDNRGLPHPMLGVTLVQQGPFGSLQSEMVNANGLDIVGIEAYVNPPGGSAAQNETVLNAFLDQAISRVPGGKKISIIMQAYARNGAWTDIGTLTSLQTVAYRRIYNNPKVVQLAMFSYGRASGTRTNPALKTPHQQIWGAIQCRGGGPGTGPGKCGSTPGCGGNSCGGSAVCCGGCGNPCNCPRLCSGGQYSGEVETSTIDMISAHPELFDTTANPWVLLSWVDAATFSNYVVNALNLNYPSLRAIIDPNDSKQVLVRKLLAPVFREDYRVINGDLTVATPSGSGYRATCTEVDLGF